MNIEIPEEAIAAFCRKWHIREMALFGSVLRDDFSGQSDIDFLVSFFPDTHCSLFDLIHMQDELKDILHRDVDLISRRGIESSRNALRREAILRCAKVIYAA